eukprot:CAMPEP_0167745358 /NCGR_PEP_ID=MMETSP0110_2-20121227/3107_1 /TAXON_ID=629695 /ORGANISM="Gymnochlora sp., Strain CCMP2014" /LENGTH=333 /DNA_ID=CAMNT_0007629991 /DNA_START=275 /DNA_END=1276 /DNA_ORIENTATION=-
MYSILSDFHATLCPLRTGLTKVYLSIRSCDIAKPSWLSDRPYDKLLTIPNEKSIDTKQIIEEASKLNDSLKVIPDTDDEDEDKEFQSSRKNPIESDKGNSSKNTMEPMKEESDNELFISIVSSTPKGDNSKKERKILHEEKKSETPMVFDMAADISDDDNNDNAEDDRFQSIHSVKASKASCIPKKLLISKGKEKEKTLKIQANASKNILEKPQRKVLKRSRKKASNSTSTKKKRIKMKDTKEPLSTQNVIDNNFKSNAIGGKQREENKSHTVSVKKIKKKTQRPGKSKIVPVERTSETTKDRKTKSKKKKKKKKKRQSLGSKEIDEIFSGWD